VVLRPARARALIPVGARGPTARPPAFRSPPRPARVPPTTPARSRGRAVTPDRRSARDPVTVPGRAPAPGQALMAGQGGTPGSGRDRLPCSGRGRGRTARRRRATAQAPKVPRCWMPCATPADLRRVRGQRNGQAAGPPRRPRTGPGTAVDSLRPAPPGRPAPPLAWMRCVARARPHRPAQPGTRRRRERTSRPAIPASAGAAVPGDWPARTADSVALPPPGRAAGVPPLAWTPCALPPLPPCRTRPPLPGAAAVPAPPGQAGGLAGAGPVSCCSPW
jgi:hypothetical protein